MTISIYGIGWFTGEGYGCVRVGQRQVFENGEGTASLPKKGIFSHPFKNFGRLDNVSKSTVYGVALALQDAGIEYIPGQKLNIGVIGTNAEGSLRTDIEFFKDYVQSGRTLSRGNLFIYTLPSSPLGEAAIHFGFLGPMLYAAAGGNALLPVLDMAAEMVQSQEASMMLAGRAEEDEAIFFIVGQEKDGEGKTLCSLSDARSILDLSLSIREIVRKFSLMETKNMTS